MYKCPYVHMYTYEVSAAHFAAHPPAMLDAERRVLYYGGITAELLHTYLVPRTCTCTEYYVLVLITHSRPLLFS